MTTKTLDPSFELRLYLIGKGESQIVPLLELLIRFFNIDLHTAVRILKEKKGTFLKCT